MKTLLLVVGLVVGMTAVASAAEQKGYQQAKGGFITGGVNAALTETTQVSGSSEEVTGIAITCGSSACAMGLYDDTGNNDDLFVAADGKAEIGAAANTTAYLDLSDRPIRFTTGVQAYLRGTTNGGVVYTSQPTP